MFFSVQKNGKLLAQKGKKLLNDVVEDNRRLPVNFIHVSYIRICQYRKSICGESLVSMENKQDGSLRTHIDWYQLVYSNVSSMKHYPIENPVKTTVTLQFPR